MDTLDAPLRRDVSQAAIEHVCMYFDKQGLTLVERWHVCESIELAALGIMGDKLRDVCRGIMDADIASLSPSSPVDDGVDYMLHEHDEQEQGEPYDDEGAENDGYDA